MLTIAPEALREHYVGCRELAYNNGRMAQSSSGRGLAKLARQQGYLQRQISMVENACRKRGLSLLG